MDTSEDLEPLFLFQSSTVHSLFMFVFACFVRIILRIARTCSAFFFPIVYVVCWFGPAGRIFAASSLIFVFIFCIFVFLAKLIEVRCYSALV